MNKKIMIVALAALAAVPALAQETKPLGVSLRAGIFFPSDKDVRDIVGKTFFAGGLEYKLRDLNLGNMDTGYSGALSISADYYGKSDASSIPVLLNYVGMSNEFFYSAGIGVAFTKTTVGTVDESKSRLGYQFGIGYNFNTGKTPFFLEAKYFGVSGRSELNGFAIYAGVRL